MAKLFGKTIKYLYFASFLIFFILNSSILLAVQSNYMFLNQSKEIKQALWLIEIPDKLPDYGEEYEINISVRDINDIRHIYENVKENFKIEVESSRYKGVCGNKYETSITDENSVSDISFKDFQVIGIKLNNIDYEPITNDLRESSAADKWIKNVSGYKNGIISLKLKSYDYGGNAKIKVIPERNNDLVVYTNALNENDLQFIANNYLNYNYNETQNIHYILQRENDNKVAYCPWDFDNDGLADSWELAEYNSDANYEKNTGFSDLQKLNSIYPYMDNEISEARKNKIAQMKLLDPSLINIKEEKKDNIEAIDEYRGVFLADNSYIRLSPYKQEYFFSVNRPNNEFWEKALQSLKNHIADNSVSDFSNDFKNSIPDSETIISLIKSATDYDVVYELANDNNNYVIITSRVDFVKALKLLIYFECENLDWSENSSFAYVKNEFIGNTDKKEKLFYKTNKMYFQIPRYYIDILNMKLPYNWNDIFSLVFKHELGHVLGQTDKESPMIEPKGNSKNRPHYIEHNCLMNDNVWSLGLNVNFCSDCYLKLNNEEREK